MGKKDKSKENLPPSLFDNLDLFAAASDAQGESEKPERKSAKSAKAAPPPPPTPASKGLTGAGPMQQLYDFNFRQYSAYVICSRAIPAVEDGLKPVQRRIMHALYEQDDGRYTKVANIVGQTMQYHPHGDASIGDAIVVLANKLWGKGKGYLIDGQGNFGSLLTGMPHAAVRYIECRLTELAKNEVFNRKTTSYVPNYDGRKQEPVYLPAKVPLLLMMGADGIAVGLSTAILPHNFIELLEAEICLIQKKPFQLYPDFQLGGTMDVSEYQDGLGKVKVRAKIEREDKNKLVITELPWGETTDSIAESIEDAIKKKKVPVRKLHDLTSDKVRIELELQAGTSQEKATVALFAFTNCEKALSSRPIVLDQGRPRLMSVTEILKKNVERLMDLTKREQEIRLGELDDLYHARTLDRIFIEERIYKRIEQEKTMEGVKAAVRTGFEPHMKELRRKVITDDDIDRLLKLQIRRISQFDINKNREEIEGIRKEEAQVKDNLVHLRAFVVKYLKGLVRQYQKNYPRCTKVESGAFKQVDVRAITATELTIRWDKENHYVGSGIRGGDELFKCSSLDELILVWRDGRFRKVLPEDKLFVDKDLMLVLRYNQEKDRETREFTCVYEEGGYGFSYIKRFRFGGLIRNKDYRLAPEKPKSKVLFFQEGCPETIYVKFKPAKGQKIHQQHFLPHELVDRVNRETGKTEKQEVVPIRSATAKGKQLTTKPIARIGSAKGSWWDDREPPSKGVLD
ncbi:MAG: DNA topoisomerase IV subunit A [Kiritimatiellae bacterium]|nr:DNA topoisomerase IV subunit A [Kiritimatiellia bacterium]MBQ3343968.1 DNA topoisomerase IV subunit A [Kiritimatiellia bacterium]